MLYIIIYFTETLLRISPVLRQEGTVFNFALQNYYFILNCAKKMKKIEKKLLQAEQKRTVPYLAV